MQVARRSTGDTTLPATGRRSRLSHDSSQHDPTYEKHFESFVRGSTLEIFGLATCRDQSRDEEDEAERDGPPCCLPRDRRHRHAHMDLRAPFANSTSDHSIGCNATERVECIYQKLGGSRARHGVLPRGLDVAPNEADRHSRVATGAASHGAGEPDGDARDPGSSVGHLTSPATSSAGPTRIGHRVVLGRHLPEMQKRTVLISAAAVQGIHTPVKQKPYSFASRNSNFRRTERSGQLASPRRSPQRTTCRRPSPDGAVQALASKPGSGRPLGSCTSTLSVPFRPMSAFTASRVPPGVIGRVTSVPPSAPASREMNPSRRTLASPIAGKRRAPARASSK